MKRRKFLKFLALIPALPIAYQGWPFKPKSKPPPIDRYDPDDPKSGYACFGLIEEGGFRTIMLEPKL